MIKFINLFFKIFLHLSAILIILVAFEPLAQWYYSFKPLWGVDFYYTVSLVNLLKSNLALPQMGWGYAWFSGWPLLSNYPILHYYLILPFTQFLPIISSVKVWMIITLFFFFAGCYASFFLTSRNFALSIILTIATIYSIGVYGTLMWGGSLPSHASQAFYPWVVFFIIAYLKYRNFRYLLTASLLNGVAILGHPQVAIAYIYPAASILMLFWFGGIKFFTRIKSLILFIIISFIIALPLVYSGLGGGLRTLFITNSSEVASSTARVPPDQAKAIEAFHKAQPLRIYTDTNTTIFAMIIISIIFMLLMLTLLWQFKLFFRTIPFIVLTFFSIFYVWIFSYGISVYHGGWYRLFWTCPFWLGLLASSFWHVGQESIHQRLKNLYKYVHVIIPLLNLVVLAVGIPTLIVLSTSKNPFQKPPLTLTMSKDIQNFDRLRLQLLQESFDLYKTNNINIFSSFAVNIQKKIMIPAKSTPSSAFPDVLNLYDDQIGLNNLKTKLVPKWLSPNQTNYRLYSADQTINIWWNALYKMPLGRGYLDPDFSNRGYLFWVDAALSQDGATGKDQLEAVFKYPGKIAFNNTLFLVDWYGFKYFEAGPSGATVTILPKELTTDTYLKNYQVLDFNKERYTKTNQILTFYEIKDEYVSPILSATNSQTLGIFASDSGYETIIRDIADMNIPSTTVIPIKLGQYIDKISEKDLRSIDGLILYDYKYSNQGNAFKLLENYLASGKKIFLDSGVEVAESSPKGSLPNIFPFESSLRKSISDEWKLELLDPLYGKNVDFSKFSPPIFDKDHWKFSYPPVDSEIKPNSQIILKNHGKVLMAKRKIGSGYVIWSGINLPYHVSRYHNSDEVSFFKNVLNQILDLSSKPAKVTAKTNFISAQTREITTAGAKGILFKEQAFPGWSAVLNSNGTSRNLKIYKAGPAIPGFMYVSIPKDLVSASNTLRLNYTGSITSWLLILFSLIIIIFIKDEILIGGRLIGKFSRFLLRKGHNRIKGWWSKDDS